MGVCSSEQCFLVHFFHVSDKRLSFLHKMKMKRSGGDNAEKFVAQTKQTMAGSIGVYDIRNQSVTIKFFL